MNWLVAQISADRQFFRKLGVFLTRSRLGIFRLYHIKHHYRAFQPSQTRHKPVTNPSQAQKLQKLYKEGYLSTLQKLSILKFFSDFREETVKQNQKTNPHPADKTQRIGLSQRLGFKPKVKTVPKTELNVTCNPDNSYSVKQFDKRWNKFIDNWFKNPINTHTQFEATYQGLQLLKYVLSF